MREVFQDCALHGELVEVCIEEREDTVGVLLLRAIAEILCHPVLEQSTVFVFDYECSKGDGSTKSQRCGLLKRRDAVFCKIK